MYVFGGGWVYTSMKISGVCERVYMCLCVCVHWSYDMGEKNPSE